jgi:hypothetical protein
VIAKPVVVDLDDSETNIAPVPVVPERAVVAVSDTSAPKMFEVASLTGLHETNVTQFNRAMKRAGRKQLLPDDLLSDDDLGRLAEMHSACSKAINVAASAVSDFQAPYGKAMSSAVREAVDAGETVPYTVLPKGRLPHRGPYDLLVTTSYLGVVYLLTIPVDAKLREVVEMQRLAEDLRIDAYTSFLADLK